MPVFPEHIDPMITAWRTLATHYRANGNSDAAIRTTRLADQLEQMVQDGTIRYSRDSLDPEPAVEAKRRCRQCEQVLPFTKFPFVPNTQTHGHQCRTCQRSHLPPSKQHRAKKPAITPIDTNLGK